MAEESPQNHQLEPDRRSLLRISGVLGFLGVALGAYGAHGLEKVVDDPKLLAAWDTAVFYHLVHAVMLYLVAVGGAMQRAAWICMAAGVVLFSGSLYGLVLSGWGWLGPVTPLGGVLMLAGWGLLVFRPAR